MEILKESIEIFLAIACVYALRFILLLLITSASDKYDTFHKSSTALWLCVLTYITSGLSTLYIVVPAVIILNFFVKLKILLWIIAIISLLVALVSTFFSAFTGINCRKESHYKQGFCWILMFIINWFNEVFYMSFVKTLFKLGQIQAPTFINIASAALLFIDIVLLVVMICASSQRCLRRKYSIERPITYQESIDENIREESNENGQITYRKLADGSWEKWEYDEYGNQTYYKNSDGQVTYQKWSDGSWAKSEYDKNCKLTYYERNTGSWAKWEYDSNGNKTYLEESGGYWEKWEYNKKGNKTYHEISDSFWEKWEYDEYGNQTYYKNSSGLCIEMGHDYDGIKVNHENSDPLKKPEEDENKKQATDVLSNDIQTLEMLLKKCKANPLACTDKEKNKMIDLIIENCSSKTDTLSRPTKILSKKDLYAYAIVSSVEKKVFHFAVYNNYDAISTVTLNENEILYCYNCYF